jgi:mismatch-specific thymine-DNA glycosylase
VTSAEAIGGSSSLRAVRRKSIADNSRPAPEQLLAARDTTIPDVVAPGLRVLFSGINPGLYSAATGYHFARPGNRFWPALHASGFTPRLLRPAEQRQLRRWAWASPTWSPARPPVPTN